MRKQFKIPKVIATHPGVAECLDAIAEGFDPPSRYDVSLKPGWAFVGLDPHNPRRSARFRSVKEFIEAEPTTQKPK